MSAFAEHIRFLFRRAFNPKSLARYSVSIDDLSKAIEGKNVAIVGNARSLSNSSLGAEIDAADIVIRVNAAPMPSQVSHGTRTDWLALAIDLPNRQREKIDPNRILWMSHKRKRLRFRDAKSKRFFLFPIQAWKILAETLDAPPTTGLMVIDLVATSNAKSISLYGFDFFSSLSLTGSRTARQVPHDFDAERKWVDGLLAHDKRVKINS